jgi:hypothetical protein
MTSKSLLISQGNEAIAEYKSQERILQAELDEQKRAISDVKIQANQAINQLVNFLMPAIIEDTSTIGQKIGYLSLENEKKSIEAGFVEWQERINAISIKEDFINHELLIHPHTGSLITERNEIGTNIGLIRESLNPYRENSNFVKLWDERFSHNSSELIDRIWRFITLQTLKYNTLVNNVLTTFGHENLDSLFADYQDKTNNVNSLEGCYIALAKRIDDIITNIKTFDDLTEKLSRKESILFDELKNTLQTYFLRLSDFKEIRNNLGDKYKIQLSTISALQQKIVLLEKSAEGLKTEINDRRKRQNDIDTVVRKWRRSSKSSIPGDKSKWLVEGPRAKRTSTTRYVSHSRSFSNSVYVFHDYGYYDRGLDLGDYLLLDMVMHQSNDRINAGYMSNIDPDFGSRNPDLSLIPDSNQNSFDNSTDALNAIASEYQENAVQNTEFGEDEAVIADIS